ncbi:uncharacterized protein LY89DRAFT_143351 [Mollisia scopiformis]|uniref:Zn(2)-C6 fungal-type domain-containing protein n=1 Tax=Mollisia scopiformis TaxID=149040 RepID=A0A194X314_MOLSC|nr:uncharacterized protein LY89DRAFT_143351 [Mollisia scopiformis]KUJ14571.1 hypothetical protein LY89DRAFT_143351 [Mollisia scopiformis]
MPEAVSNSDKGTVRKIRAHKKSRQGCGNCKLRAVKCDESRPICKRCKAYGVVCNYGRKSPDLELSSSGGFHVSVLNDSSLSSPEAGVPKSIAPSLKQGLAASLESYASDGLSRWEFELLHRFQLRTIYTVTTAKSLAIYQSSILKYACSHPYLLHGVLALTLLHDRYFSPLGLNSSLTPSEVYHWGRSLNLYSLALTKPIAPASRDPLWATAAFLGVLSIAHVEARTAKDSWPYAPPSLMDLSWLKMSEGKKTIWKDGNAFMEESDFRILAHEQQGNYQPPLVYGSKEGICTLPSNFLAYFAIGDGFDLIDNPYYASVYSLAQSWKLTSAFQVIMNWIFYITNMENRYKTLLRSKDPRALLLMAYWYRLAAETKHWFLMRRVHVECESICLYLEQHYSQDHELQILLEYPRSILALGSP